MEDEAQQEGAERSAESAINLTVLDPPRFGWTAAGGVAEVLTPHEVSSLLRSLSRQFNLRHFPIVWIDGMVIR